MCLVSPTGAYRRVRAACFGGRHSFTLFIAVVVACWALAFCETGYAQAGHDVQQRQASQTTGEPGIDHNEHEHWANGPTDIWLPAHSPDAGGHTSLHGWDVAFHGQAFAQYVDETGSGHYRGRQFGSTNWFMASAARGNPLRQVRAQAMLTAEPWTVRGCGYPTLLATGETCAGDSIHDRQHPHDLFMELAGSYEQTLSPSTRWGVYGGPVGAPALGPPPFMHRPSAVANPIAPIGHHWLDSTHVTFGVLTAAVSGRRWKVESSVFNGREPDEHRRDFDLGALDSFSARVSVNPATRLALQVSAGHLNDAEAGIGRLPRQDVNHFTASAIGVRQLAHGTWSTTIAYGLKWGPTPNGASVISQQSSAVLLESSASTSERDTWFGRAEIVGKPAHDLHADEFAPAVFAVGKLQFGYVRRVAAWQGLSAGIGASMDAAIVPSALAPRYAGTVAPGVAVFLRVSTADGRSH